MILTTKELDINFLKSKHVRLYYFGLGFIQLKLNDVERLHFYSSKLPAITEDIHAHRYGFLSRILKGELTNNTWTVCGIGEPGDHEIVAESCNPDIKNPDNKKISCTVLPGDSQTYHEGESYVMTADMYHTVSAKNCITYLTRTHKLGNFARVVLPNGKAPVCPFSKKIPEQELWEIMKEMVSEK